MADDEMSVEDELGSIFDAANAESPVETGPAADDAPADNADDEVASPSLEDAPAEISEADPGETTPEPLSAPSSWSADAVSLWEGASRELQEHLLKEAEGRTQAESAQADRLKALDTYERVLEPVRQEMLLNGIQPAQFLGSLVTAHQYLQQNPGEAIQWLARQYGYDLSNINQQEQPDIDPTLQPLVQQVEAIKQQFSGFMTEQQQREQAQAASVVDQFFNDPANTYAKRLEAEIFAEIPGVNANNPNASPAERLKLAYDRAVRLSDTVQSEIAAAKAKEAEDKRKAEAAKKAADAKRLAESNLRSDGTNAGDSPPAVDRETELGQTYDALQGAA